MHKTLWGSNPDKHKRFISSLQQMSILPLEPTQTTIQCSMGLLPKSSGQGTRPTTQLHQLLRLRRSGPIAPMPHFAFMTCIGRTLFLLILLVRFQLTEDRAFTLMYQGWSTEKLKSAIKIQNTARLSSNLTTVILMV